MTIYDWEHTKSRPRKEQFAGLVALRGLGKRDTQAKLALLAAAQKKTGSIRRSLRADRDSAPIFKYSHPGLRLVVCGDGDRLLLAVLLACHLTSSYSAAETAFALKLAREEAERIHGPLVKRPFLVTDNGPSFIARRFTAFVKDQFSHVRIQYRTPQQLGLLERFHATLKTEEVYWRIYDHPQHARTCLPATAEYGKFIAATAAAELNAVVP